MPAIVVIAATAAVGLATDAPADDRFWLGNTGLWNTPANWNPAFAPGVGDRVVFNTATTSDAQFSSSVTIDTLDFQAGTVDLVSTDATVHTLNIAGVNGINITGGSLSSAIAIDCDQTISVDAPFEMNSAPLECLKLFIGLNASAAMSSNGTTIRSSNVRIGNETGSAGQLNMDGGEFLPIGFPVTVQLMNGQVQCTNGAIITTTIFDMAGSATQPTNAVVTLAGGSELNGNVTIGRNGGPGTAEVNITDGSLIHGSTINVRDNAVLNVIDAECEVIDSFTNEGDTIIENSTVYMDVNFFDNYGRFAASGLIHADTPANADFTNFGDLYIGGENEVGELDFDNIKMRFNTGGTTHIDIAGLGSGQFDQMTFSGIVSINLRGTLMINFLNGYAPQVNDEFVIMAPGSPAATISASNYTLVPPPGYTLTLITTATSAKLRVTAAPCLADIAGSDGIVNTSDLFALLANWATAGPGANLAPPIDVVNVSDLFALLAAWGNCP